MSSLESSSRLQQRLATSSNSVPEASLPSVAYAYTGFFGGDQGLGVNFTTPSFLGVNFPLTRWEAWVCSAVALVTLAGRPRAARPDRISRR